MALDLARFGGALLHRDEWRALGAHPRMLASDQFVTVFPGYLTPASRPATFNAMAHVLQNRVRPGSVLSHSTAAVLWDLPLPAAFESGVGLLRVPVPVDERTPGKGARARADPASDPLPDEYLFGPNGLLVPAVRPGLSLGGSVKLPVLHIRVGPGASSSLGRGATVHRGLLGPAVQHLGLTVSTRPQTLRELATMLPLWDVVAIADALLVPSAALPTETIPSLQAALRDGRGTRGTARARRALALARTDVRSPTETVMRLLIEEVGLPSPTPNLPVRDPVTKKMRYIDLAWPALRFGLEYDGDGHRVEKGQWQSDEARRDELAALGWTLSRANGADLRRPLRILLRLRTALGQRGLPVPDADSIRSAVARIAADPPSLRIDRVGSAAPRT